MADEVVSARELVPYPSKAFLLGLTKSEGGAKHEALYFEHYRKQGVVLRKKYRL